MKNGVEKYIRKFRNTKNALLISMLIGSLLGAVVTLLYAPQSGKQTRDQIHLRSVQLHDRDQLKRVSAILQAGNTSVEAA